MAPPSSSSGGGEIEEVEEPGPAGRGQAPAADEIVPAPDDDASPSILERDGNGDYDKICVAVGTGKSSEGALAWTLEREARAWSVVFLVHVYPEVRLIPTPLGMIPKEKVEKAQLEKYLYQEEIKRHKMLQKFVEQCTLFGVKYQIELIESDQTVTAILELITAYEIKRLIVGTSRSKLRRWNKSKAGQIHKNAPEYCKVHVICEGEEVAAPDQPAASSAPSPSERVNDDDKNNTEDDKNSEGVGEDKIKSTRSCGMLLGWLTSK